MNPRVLLSLCGLAAVAAQVAMDPDSGVPMVGASGAIFGLLAATVVVGRAHGGEWGRATSRQALLLAAIWFAHTWSPLEAVLAGGG